MPQRNLKPSTDKMWVRRQPDAYLNCRALRHSWAVSYAGPFNGLPEHLQERLKLRADRTPALVTECTRCDTYRVYLYPGNVKNLNGERWRAYYRRYLYPGDYTYREKDRPAGRIKPRSGDYIEELFKRAA